MIHQLQTGVDYRYDKNLGNGLIANMERPMYPSGAIERPRDLNKIPALQDAAFYVEDKISHRFNSHVMDVMAGIRFSWLPGLSDRFSMKGKVYSDPRMNLRWNFPALSINVEKLNLALTAGIGWHSKTPTMNMLYPALSHDDYYELNYYPNKSEKLRRMHVYTIVSDLTNYDLQPARNLKKEIGFSASLGRNKMDVTIFHEKMESGFHSSSFYNSVTYRDYEESSVPSDNLTAPPLLSAFQYEDKTVLDRSNRWTNSTEIDKKGIEYQLTTSKIKAIYTQLSVTGAWFKTKYSDSRFGYDRPGIYLKDDPYPYVGVYEWTLRGFETKEWFNTNVRFDTHLPMLRLLASTSVQIIWFEKSQRAYPNGTPLAYIDTDGQMIPYSSNDADDLVLSHLMKTKHSLQDKENTEPVGLTIDMKLTKEIGDKLRVSFFVQNLFDYYKPYATVTNQVIRRTSKPFFGMEANIKL